MKLASSGAAHPLTPSSTDLGADARERLASLFPEVLRDGRIDLDRLRELLGAVVDDGAERFGLSWVGRRDAIRLLQTPTQATLAPERDDSLSLGSARHTWIAGENLEVLKVLHRSYHDRVKAIYIDPPYNTGKDFVYRDDYAAPLREYLRQTGQIDAEGNRTSSELETQGRRHSAWLSMIYPRLKLAHQLLRPDGVIFVSIDDNEEASLRLVMDEVFGETNRLGTLVWHLGVGPTAGHFLRSHETVLCYARDKSQVPNFVWRGGGEVDGSALKRISPANPASQITFPAGIEIDGGGDHDFPAELGGTVTQTVVAGLLSFRDGKLVAPVTLRAGWAMKTQIESWIRGDETYDTQGQRVVRFYFNSGGTLKYEKDRSVMRPRTVVADVGATATGADDIESLGFNRRVFDYPKPVALIRTLIGWVTAPTGGDIVLDFFAGSGTTAHAVLALNAADGGDRQSISVQFPEQTPSDSVARSAGFATLADVGLARVVAAAQKVGDGSPGGAGVRAFTLSSTTIRAWEEPNERTPEALLAQLSLTIDPLLPGWTPDRLAYEIALKEGYGLDLQLQPVGNASDSLLRVTDTARGRRFWLYLADRVDATRLEQAGVGSDDLIVCRDAALDDSTAANLELRYRVATL
jgi:adenine-specific DNA-methyltransferase